MYSKDFMSSHTMKITRTHRERAFAATSLRFDITWPGNFEPDRSTVRASSLAPSQNGFYYVGTSRSVTTLLHHHSCMHKAHQLHNKKILESHNSCGRGAANFPKTLRHVTLVNSNIRSVCVRLRYENAHFQMYVSVVECVCVCVFVCV